MALPRMAEVSHPRQPAPLGVRAPAGSPPRAARTSPSGIPLASVDLWPCATRFRALHTGEVVCAIPDLRAVGSALLRIRLRAVGSFGRRAIRPTPPSSMAAPSLTPPRPCLRGFQATQSSRASGHKGMAVCAAVGGPVSATSLTRTLRGWTAPALRWAARRCSGPPSARQRARPGAAPCLIAPRGAQR